MSFRHQDLNATREIPAKRDLPIDPVELYLDDAPPLSWHPKFPTLAIRMVIYWRLCRRGLRPLYFPPSKKSTWLTVLDEQPPTASRFLVAAAHVPGFLWCRSAPRFRAPRDFVNRHRYRGNGNANGNARYCGHVTSIMIQFRKVNSIGSRSADQWDDYTTAAWRSCLLVLSIYEITRLYPAGIFYDGKFLFYVVCVLDVELSFW